MLICWFSNNLGSLYIRHIQTYYSPAVFILFTPLKGIVKSLFFFDISILYYHNLDIILG